MYYTILDYLYKVIQSFLLDRYITLLNYSFPPKSLLQGSCLIHGLTHNSSISLGKGTNTYSDSLGANRSWKSIITLRKTTTKTKTTPTKQHSSLQSFCSIKVNYVIKVTLNFYNKMANSYISYHFLSKKVQNNFIFGIGSRIEKHLLHLISHNRGNGYFSTLLQLTQKHFLLSSIKYTAVTSCGQHKIENIQLHSKTPRKGIIRIKTQSWLLIEDPFLVSLLLYC